MLEVLKPRAPTCSQVRGFFVAAHCVAVPTEAEALLSGTLHQGALRVGGAYTTLIQSVPAVAEAMSTASAGQPME